MIYHGYCDKQGEDYSVEFRSVNPSTLEDESIKFDNGRLVCKYAGITGCCRSPKQCSILNPTKE